jgi:hypothetical protein
MEGMAVATPAAIAAGIAAGSWAIMHVKTRNLRMQRCCFKKEWSLQWFSSSVKRSYKFTRHGHQGATVHTPWCCDTPDTTQTVDGGTSFCSSPETKAY